MQRAHRDGTHPESEERRLPAASEVLLTVQEAHEGEAQGRKTFELGSVHIKKSAATAATEGRC